MNVAEFPLTESAKNVLLALIYAISAALRPVWALCWPAESKNLAGASAVAVEDLANNSSKVPVLRDMRVIALAT